MDVMRRRRAVPLVLGLVVLTACTQADETPPPSSSASTSSPSISPEPATTLASGEPLPEGCDTARVRPAQTVAFVAGGRAWALDPVAGTLTCLAEVADAGPFAWGPQGDRVVLDGLEVLGFSADAPSLDAIGATPAAFDWGHPLGLSIVFAEADAKIPDKRYMDDGRVDRLPDMPRGTYIDIAYHPSGLALAFAIEQHGEQSIWISTNEGEDPERLVFSQGGTTFSSVAFSADGKRLVWTAQHLNSYPQIHWMALTDRSGFIDHWRGDDGHEATNLLLAPGSPLMAVDDGGACDDRAAMVVLSPSVARPALPDETRPTHAVGWLDRTTLLVAAGGCDDPLDLFSVDVTDEVVADLVTGVDVAASRASAPPGPDSVPIPPQTAPPAPPEGVG